MGDSRRSRRWPRFPNLNRLFPRLGIRAKLVIAFSFIALVPLAVTSAVGVWVTADQMRSETRTSLEYGLTLAEQQTAREFGDSERHIRALTDNMLRPLLEGATPERRSETAAMIRNFLVPASQIFRVKLVRADGQVVFMATTRGEAGATELEQESGHYYAWRARRYDGPRSAVFPVELRGEGVLVVVPAVAFLSPIHDPDGELLGAVVGEAFASALLTSLEAGTTDPQSVTGLVDQEGFYLYHSLHKRDWSTLLVNRREVNLWIDFPASVAQEIRSGDAGTLTTADGRLVSYRPIDFDPGSGIHFTLFRSVPIHNLSAPVRRFLASAALGGIPVVLLVLFLATVTAEQFTRPIYQLREEAKRLAGGAAPSGLDIATNDELEDLAGEFAVMADSLAQHRQQLEQLVAERTRELGAANAELSEIMLHSADAIISVDLQDRVRVWNQGAENLFGYAAPEAIGRDVTSLIGPSGNGAQRERDYIRRELADHGAVVNLQTERRHRHGHILSVSLTQTVITDGEGHPLGSSLIIRDGRQEARLNEQMRRSERIAAVNVMAAGLAHELNNPVAIILNRIECMQEDVRERSDDAALQRDLLVLREHVTRLASLTNDLLRYAREDPDELTVVDLEALGRRVIALLERTFGRRGVAVQFRAPDSLSDISGHEKALETVLVNLLLNAADVTQAGGTVTVGLRSIEQLDAVELTVADTGPGIPADLRDRIFDPFFTTKAGDTGTGLGLTVCRSIVQRHGGAIGVEERTGGGSRFVVTLPRDPLDSRVRTDGRV
jgi:PAS domain S-box-containing protein